MRLKSAYPILMSLILIGIPACDEVSYPVIAGEEFEAVLTGANLVPPVTTTATGTVLFTAVQDTFLIFRVDVADIDSVTAVHIHQGAAGVTDTTRIVTLFTGPNCKSNQGGALTIISSSVGNPTVIKTATAHQQTIGGTSLIRIANHAGSTPSLVGEHSATFTGDSTFSIPVNVTVGGTGGTAQRFNLINTDSPRCRVDYVGAAGTGQLRPTSTALRTLPTSYGATAQERMAELIARMRAGTVYVDVHTRLNTAGEVRGQVEIR